MTSRPVLTALLVAALAGPAAASSWICSDPETDALRKELVHAQKIVMALKARTTRAEHEVAAVRAEAARYREESVALARSHEALKRRLAELEAEAAPPAPRKGWAQAIQDLRRDGDVNVGLSTILQRMEARGLAPHRIRKLAQRLARYDGVLEAALETPAPERDLERFGVIMDKVERHADNLAAEIVRRLDRLQGAYGGEFSPSALDDDLICDFGCDDDLSGDDDLAGDDFGLGGDDFGDF